MDTFNKIINSSRPVLVDFYAEWCAPCKMMAPILKQTKDALGDKIRIIKIDTEKNMNISAIYNIRSVPTLMLFKNNKVIWQTQGLIQANALIKIMNQYIN